MQMYRPLKISFSHEGEQHKRQKEKKVLHFKERNRKGSLNVILQFDDSEHFSR